MYHDGNRRLQDEFDSRRISDRLGSFTRTAFTPDDQAFIEAAIYFFIATADAEGRPDCSFKGGAPGFVRMTGPSELAFPDYDGNGMYLSTGNMLANPDVGLLFIDLERGHRMRLEGTASIDLDDPLATAHTLLLATNALLPTGLSAQELGDRGEVEARASRVADLLLNGLLSRGQPSTPPHPAARRGAVRR